MNPDSHASAPSSTASSAAVTDTASGRVPKTVRFSIVTPTLNAAEFLADCLDSVVAQRGSGIEVEHLILDGGSTDATRDILAGYPVKMLPRSPDQALTAAMCLGFESAQGDLVSFLGADDLLLPGALQAVAAAWRQEQRSIIFARSRWCSADLRTLGELAPPPRWMTATMHACLGWNYVGAANCFIAPSLYRELGGFDPTFPRAEDYEFYTRVLSRQIPFTRLNQAVCIYRRHGQNESVRYQVHSHGEHETIQQRYGPRTRWAPAFLRWGLKSWIYGRNLTWAYHQLSGKLVARTTAWRGGDPGK
jgi:glycosyltransferase involved in cell wall biosynthesis